MTTLGPDVVDRAISGEPAWRAQQRKTAYDSYVTLGMPDARDEMWKYVELDFDIADFALGEADEPADHSSLAGDWNDVHAVLVDGRVTTISGAGDGLTVAALADAGDIAERLAASGVAADTDIFAAANDAFGAGGLVIHAGRGATASPVLVDVYAGGGGSVSFPRVLIATDDLAHASVVIHLRSAPGSDALVVPRVEIAAGSASNVDVSIVQTLDRSARSIGHLRSVIGRDATVTVAEAGIGAVLARWHLTVDLEGRGSNANIIGAYFGDQSQVLDYRYLMHHAGLNTNSEMFLKGAVEDEALSVFTGMIRIDEGAQRTDAYQTNRNLILSDGAAAQSVPNLEILANDVKCGHGSSVGPLDEEQRYYLMSRGIDEERADRLQVRGFFEEAIARFPHAEIADALRKWINAKFIEAQETGRV